MASIKVSELEAIVDDENIERLSQYKWRLAGTKREYAARGEYIGSGHKNRVHKIIYMHREILNAPKGAEVDHINGNKLDNRKCNLRLATSSQNKMNRGARIDSPTGIKGVQRSGKKFTARIRANNINYYIGSYNTIEEAAKAYKDAAAKIHGLFANQED